VGGGYAFGKGLYAPGLPANTYSPLSPENVAALQAHQQQQLEAVMEAEIDEDDLECLLLAL